MLHLRTCTDCSYAVFRYATDIVRRQIDLDRITENNASLPVPAPKSLAVVSILAQLFELLKYAGQMLSVCLPVCLDVNQAGTNCNHCTQRLVILHAWTY